MELLIKIVYLSDATIPSEMANSVSIINLCNAFNELGAEIHLVKPWRYKNRKINPDDIYKIYGINNKFNIVNTPYLDLSMIQNFSPDLLLRSVNYVSKRIWQKHVVNYVVNNFSPDIIHMRNNIPFALYHLRKMNKLVFLEFYDVPTKFYLDIYKKAIIGNKNLILSAITSNLADKISELFQIERKRIAISPSGVDKSKYQQTTFNINKIRKTIMYVGNLYPDRGVNNFVLAAKNIPEHDFVVIGGNKSEADDLIKNFNLSNKNLSFIPHQSHSELSQFYAKSDILILPDTAKNIWRKLYVSPNKLFEYMAACKPIIASDLPSIKEVVTDKHSALLFTPDDPKDLTEKINKLVNNEQLSNLLSRNAFNLVDNYTWKTKAKNMLDLIKNRIK